MGVSKNRGGPPKSSILIGFSIIFTIHFGLPLFLEIPKYDHPESHPQSFFGFRPNLSVPNVQRHAVALHQFRTCSNDTQRLGHTSTGRVTWAAESVRLVQSWALAIFF